MSVRRCPSEVAVRRGVRWPLRWRCGEVCDAAAEVAVRRGVRWPLRGAREASPCLTLVEAFMYQMNTVSFTAALPVYAARPEAGRRRGSG